MNRLEHIVSAACLAAVALSPQFANANTTHYYSGQVCQGENEADRAALKYNSYGVTQIEAYAERNVKCPLSAFDSSTVDIDTATLRFIDQTDDGCLSCLIRIRNNTGTSYTSSTLYSTNLTGGSTSCTPSTEGYGYLEWTGSELPNSGSSISSVASYNFECTIPTYLLPSEAEEAYTHILGFSVDQVNP